MKRLLAGASLLGALACGPTACVARGTRVRTPRGLRLIEEIGVGDEVFCVEPDTGQLVVARVSAARSAHRECVSLGFGENELIATSDHPIYCPDTRQWAPAGEWALGKRSWLLQVSGDDVTPVKLDRTSTFCGIHEVFDLTVDHPLHNFVANDVLVHNKSMRCTLPDGQPVDVSSTCACPGGGQGRISCESSPGKGTCVDCPDAGTNDAGQ